MSSWTVCALVSLALASPAAAQVLPSEPIQAAGGRLVIAGEMSASLAPVDEGYFNFTDYEHNALRLIRLSASANLRLADRVSLLGEVRTENWDTFRPYALFVRVRPWAGRPIDIQAGRIPPTFGAFARRSYGAGNPLIGYPLAYQYLTSLRADALPASADDLLRMRGRGWLTQFPLGVPDAAPGLPLMTSLRWDTGVQVRVGSQPVQLAAALTNGSLSNPRLDDGNGGKQVVVRVLLQPSPGLAFGVSGARGEYAHRGVLEGVPGVDGQPLQQQAFGADLEYSRDHWLVRSEVLLTTWDVPAVRAPFLDGPLRAAGISVEGRYTVRPGLYAAARVDRLGFSEISGTLFGGRPMPWDAPVSRLEIGTGYYLQRNVVAKIAYQQNWRDGGARRRESFAAAQILYWF